MTSNKDGITFYCNRCERQVKEAISLMGKYYCKGCIRAIQNSGDVK